MKTANYTPKQEVSWCKTVIRNNARNLRKQHLRWRRDVLILNTEDEHGEEIQNRVPAAFTENEFNEVEWKITLNEVLSPSEQCVITKLYLDDASQRTTAKHCRLSQSRVSRIKQQALQKLRKAMVK